MLSENVQSVRSTVSAIWSSTPPGPWVVLPEIVQSVNSDRAAPTGEPAAAFAALLFEIVQPVSSAQPLLVNSPLPLTAGVARERAVGQRDRAVIIRPGVPAALLLPDSIQSVSVIAATLLS